MTFLWMGKVRLALTRLSSRGKPKRGVIWSKLQEVYFTLDLLTEQSCLKLSFFLLHSISFSESLKVAANFAQHTFMTVSLGMISPSLQPEITVLPWHPEFCCSRHPQSRHPRPHTYSMLRVKQHEIPTMPRHYLYLQRNKHRISKIYLWARTRVCF